MPEKLKNLNAICDRSKKGIYKKWIYKSNVDYHRFRDYMQKINYCIQDLNAEINSLNDLKTKDIVYIIVSVVWIQHAVRGIKSLLKENILKDFNFKNEEALLKSSKYINALRSVAVAHPLETTEHKNYGFDGNYICIDIRLPKDDYIFRFDIEDRIMLLSLDGLCDTPKDADFYLYVYSEKDDSMKHLRYIGCNFADIYHVAELFIEKLYAMDKYLLNIKKAEYEVK